MSRVYLAGPLFSSAERACNLALCDRIEALGHAVFLPQRDGLEARDHRWAELPRDERRARMFAQDRDEVERCDVFLFVTDGRVPDEGAAVELGIAHEHRRLTGVDRLLVALHTDTRVAFPHARLNPMLSQAMDDLFTDVDELLARLADRGDTSA